MREIGVIGLGAMGLGIARSIRRAGHGVHVYDIRKETAERFAAEGGRACATPADVASCVDTLLSVVVDAAQTEEVLFGPHGAVTSMARGTVFVMCSTVDPRWIEALADRLATHGIHCLDAPVSGGATLASEGRLTLITSGSEAAYAAAGDLLQAIATHVYRVGEHAGAGSTVKMVNQLLVGIHIAATAEAMAFALRQGIDPAKVHEVITNSAGSSRMFEAGAPAVLRGNYTGSAALDIHVKDLGLVLDAAQAARFPLPLAATAHQMFLQASAAGHGREASAAVIKVFPGIRLPASD